MRAWLVRAGRGGEREAWALGAGCTGGGFGGVADLGGAVDREAVLAAVRAAKPDAAEQALRNFTAQLWALRSRMAEGDLVVMPLKSSGQHLAIGEVTGGYRYSAAEPDVDRRHVRPVRWLVTDLPRTVVKQDLLYSFGAFSTVCELSRNDAAWRVSRLAELGRDPGARASTPAPKGRREPEEAPDEVADSAQHDVDIARYALDRIASRTIEEFAGHRLADLVAAVLTAEGFQCEKSPPGADQGVDVLAGTGALGLGEPRLVVQVKSEAGQVGLPVVQQLQGAATAHGAAGLLVAWGGITKQAKQYLSTQRFTIKVWDSELLLERVFANYPALPAELRAELPLRQVWALVEDG
ncbi:MULTISPECIES: restriction endonuclease [Actinosynnema]|uniref:restriction endonuclease n=1 Tax=Actinosynnema TaxID=40566 RepID=UPI0020A48FA4|nr:restriction endonuclease [Actinosynnema pretiosum]MCP2094994.1 restriction system protein [Actinosynnema pretiosum]